MAINVVDLLAFFISLLSHVSNNCFAKFVDYDCIFKNFVVFHDFFRSGAILDLIMIKKSRAGLVLDPTLYGLATVY